MAIFENLEILIQPIVEDEGCDFWGLDYQANKRKGLLRVYIDKPEGIDIDDCERVSRQVSSVLDVEDIIRSEYTLEVSSPGMDRRLYKLDQFRQYVGEQVNLKLRLAFENRRNFKGLLKGIEDDEVVLEVEGEELVLPYELIEKANIIPRFK